MFLKAGKIGCSKCGEWLLTTGKSEEDDPVEIFPPVPLLIRLVRRRAIAQVLCPYCGALNEQPTIDAPAPVPPAMIHVIAGTRQDEWGVESMVVEHAELQAMSIEGPLAPHIEAFKTNIGRLDGLGSALVMAVGLTHLSGMKYYNYTTIQDFDQDTPPAPLISNYLSQTALYLRTTEQLRADIIKHGKSEVMLWLLHHRSLQTGVETILSSQLVALWTAIEVLASDLWETALNAHPKILADLLGTTTRIKRGSGGDAPERMDVGKSREVPLSEISRVTRGRYDLSARMGTLLRPQFNFSTLSGIRVAYSVAFSKHHTNIDKSIGSYALDAASIARNLLVHKAGVADEEYVKKAGAAGLPNLAIGERFPLSGKRTAKIVSDALDAAIKLIKAVDGWLRSH